MNASLSNTRNPLHFADQQSLQSFICTICQGVVHDAVEPVCGRGLCGHLFCRSCIQSYIEHCTTQRTPTKCPTCRETFSSTRDPSAGLLGRRAGLVVKCLHGGCDWKGDHGSEGSRLDSHVKQCLQAPWECPGCHTPFAQAQQLEHTLFCDEIAVGCWLCTEQVPRNASHRHMDDECKNRDVSCPECDDLVPFCDLAEHEGQLACLRRQLFFPNANRS